MKKYLFLMALSLVMGAAAYAQEAPEQTERKDPPTVEEMAKMKADRMKRQLLLGNDQYDKVYKLCLKQAEAQRKLMEQMKKEQDEMSQQMKGILNEAQYERYEQLQSFRRDRRMPARSDGRFAPGRPADVESDGLAPAPMRKKGPAIDVKGDPRRNMKIERGQDEAEE